MLKTIGKVLVILVVAGLFAAGIYALVENSTLAAAGGFSDAREFGENRVRPENLDQGAGVPGAPTDGRFANRPERGFRGDHDHGEFSLGRGLAGMFGQMIKIAVITGLVLLAQKFLSGRASPAKASSQV